MGNTEVNAGTLEVLGSDALPYESGLIVDANGTVESATARGRAFRGLDIIVRDTARGRGCVGAGTGHVVPVDRRCSARHSGLAEAERELEAGAKSLSRLPRQAFSSLNLPR